MNLAKVVGNVVSTQKDSNLVGCKLLIIKKINENGEFENTPASPLPSRSTLSALALVKPSL